MGEERKKNTSRIAFACLMIICSVIESAGGAVFTVGDSSGWSFNVDYATWASGKTFAVGDTLVFKHSPGHNVDEVSGSDYKACTVANVIASDSSGATTILLKTAGPHYYICGIPGHCTGGMKLAINVAASPAPPTTFATLPPPASIATLPPPAAVVIPVGATYIDPYSSSARLSPMAAVVFGIAVLNFFYTRFV